MKRKILAMICAAVMAVGLAACAMPANESQSSQQQFAEAEKQKKPAPKPEESIKDLPDEEPPAVVFGEMEYADRSALSERDGEEREIAWSYTEKHALPTSSSWTTEDDYSSQLRVESGEMSATFSNSQCATEAEIAELLTDFWGCDESTFLKGSYDRKAVYVGSREWDFGMNYYVFQDIGKDSYLLIFIHDKANQEPAAVISEFLVP